jgi:putative endonuclease
MERGGWVYILTNKYHNVLYTGVTSDLRSRIWEHKNKAHPESFTSKYNVDKLVCYKFFDTILEAIESEKKIKGGSRKKKIKLIEMMNSHWEELYSEEREY